MYLLLTIYKRFPGFTENEFFHDIETLESWTQKIIEMYPGSTLSRENKLFTLIING